MQFVILTGKLTNNIVNFEQLAPDCHLVTSPYCVKAKHETWCSSPKRTTVMILNFRTRESFAVIYLKFKQRGQTLGYFVKKMQIE